MRIVAAGYGAYTARFSARSCGFAMRSICDEKTLLNLFLRMPHLLNHSHRSASNKNMNIVRNLIDE